MDQLSWDQFSGINCRRNNSRGSILGDQLSGDQLSGINCWGHLLLTDCSVLYVDCSVLTAEIRMGVQL